MTSPWQGSISPDVGDGGDSNLNLPNWNVPLVDRNGLLTKPWQRYIENGFKRMGGNDAPSNIDLASLTQLPRPVFVAGDEGDAGDNWPIPGPRGETGNQGDVGLALFFLADDAPDVASEVISFLGR